MKTVIDCKRFAPSWTFCVDNVKVGNELSVDQSLVLFKGRVKFRQYIKTKRARFGIKLYALTTSDVLTLDFLVYCGKGMFYNDKHNSTSSTERIPTVLMGHTWEGTRTPPRCLF